MEKTLEVLCNELHDKALERGCNFICIVEHEDNDEGTVSICGDRVMLAELISKAAKGNELLLDVLDKAVLDISVWKLDELLGSKNNPLRQKEEYFKP